MGDILRITQPTCPALLHLNEIVILQCSLPAGHETLPEYPTDHMITLKWQNPDTHIVPDEE